MTEPGYPPAGPEIAERRNQLVPAVHDAFQEFSRPVLAESRMDAKREQLIAVVALVTRCPDGIRGHTRAALHTDTSEHVLLVWSAAQTCPGRADGHSAPAPQRASGARHRHAA